MNTPKSKTNKRQRDRPLVEDPEEALVLGLLDEKYITALGRVVSRWPAAEEAMVFVMADLLGGLSVAPARQVFHSVQSVSARVRIMRSALENAIVNQEKSEWYDHTIDEFAALNGIRNKFVHGLWYTGETRKTYLSQQSTSETFYMDAKKPVQLKELEELLDRINGLWSSAILDRPSISSSHGKP